MITSYRQETAIVRLSQRADGLLQKRMLLAAALFVFGIFLAPATTTLGAEIDCLAKYDGASIPPPEYLPKFWPSGFRPSAGMCRVAFLHGTIEKGDYEKFRALLRPNSRYLNFVKLDSLGGSLDESMKIGKLMREYLLIAEAPDGHTPDADSLGLQPRLSSYTGGELSTSSPSNDLCRGTDCVCASACALIWFGATTREGTVGLHRPHTDDPEFTNASPQDASKLYRQMIGTVLRYMDEMEVPRVAKDIFAETNSSEIKWLYTSIDDRSLDHPPSYSEWLSASCGRLTNAEYNTYWKLVGKEARSENDAMLYYLLSKKEAEGRKCEAILRYSRVGQLAPP
jgi:hypothetical protein